MCRLRHPKRVLAEAKLVSSHFGAVELKDNSLLVEQFNLPPRFNRRTSRLLIVLSDNYPESPPKDMYLEKGLKKHRDTPEHYFENQHGNRDIRKLGYAWYSIHFRAWHPSSQSIIQGDNLLTAINALYDALKYDEDER